MCNGNQDKNKELGAPDVQSNEKNYQLTENELGEIAAGQKTEEQKPNTEDGGQGKKERPRVISIDFLRNQIYDAIM